MPLLCYHFFWLHNLHMLEMIYPQDIFINVMFFLIFKKNSKFCKIIILKCVTIAIASSWLIWNTFVKVLCAKTFATARWFAISIFITGIIISKIFAFSSLNYIIHQPTRAPYEPARPICAQESIFWAFFGPKILIFTGGSKSFGTPKRENPPGHLVASFFGRP